MREDRKRSVDAEIGDCSHSAQDILSSQALGALAVEAGFDLVGFARAEPIPEHYLLEWLEAGFAADMDWLKGKVYEKLDVSKLLPGAKTVMSLACNYHHTSEESPIAKYARGRDYHGTMRQRLRALRRSLRARFPKLRDYGCVDAGPVMEKVWAARAGVGYIGKNSCLITPQFGSWVVLSALILDAEVDSYATPIEDRCGKCDLCVVACPTGAIEPGRKVDAVRCLSYQTIENSELVPLHLREGFASVVFGCDICQDVCPLNDSPLLAGERFTPRAVGSRSVLDFLSMTPEQYAEWVPGTALARAGYHNLRRNAAYAAGAAREVRAVVALQALLNDDDEGVKDAARWALSRLA